MIRGNDMFETGAERPGFRMRFSNGNMVSVQWSHYNYCDHDSNDIDGETYHFSANAEIAAWDKEGMWYDFGSDEVAGYQTPDQVASFIRFVSNPSCVLTEDVWVMPKGIREKPVTRGQAPVKKNRWVLGGGE